MRGTLRQLLRSTTLGVALLLGLDALAGQETQEFLVEGVMRITQPHSPFDPTSRWVQIIYRGGQWAIREIMKTRLSDPATYPADLPVPNVAVHMLSSDGTNIYYESHLETNPITSASFEHPNAIPNSLYGHIHPPGFPKWVMEPTMVSLFYAYLSASYLDEVTNNLLEPIKFAPDELTFLGDRPVRAIYQRTPDSHGLPREIAFLYDGKSTNFLLAASNFTVGLQLPMRVTVKRYDTRNGDPRQIYEFDVSDIKRKAGPLSFIPELTPGALVRDYRFSHGSAYVQGIDHGFVTNWPTEAEAKLRPDYEGNKIDSELRRIHSLTGSW